MHILKCQTNKIYNNQKIGYKQNNNINFCSNKKFDSNKCNNDCTANSYPAFFTDTITKDFNPVEASKYITLYKKLETIFQNDKKVNVKKICDEITSEIYKGNLGDNYDLYSFINMTDEEIQNFLKIKNDGVELDLAATIAQHKNYLKKYIDLLSQDMDMYDVKWRAIMMDEEEKIADSLIEKDISKRYAYMVALSLGQNWSDYFLELIEAKNLDETEANNLANAAYHEQIDMYNAYDYRSFVNELLDLGYRPLEIIDMIGVSNYSIENNERILKFAKQKLDFETIENLIDYDDNICKQAIEYSSKKNTNPQDIAYILSNKLAFIKYGKYLEFGFDEPTGSTLANTDCVNNDNFEDMAKIINCIKSENKNYRISKALNKFFDDNQNIDIADFSKYLQQIDFKNLEILEPEIKTFSPKQKLIFANYHYQENRTKFKKSDLTLDIDFSEFLANTYVNSSNLYRLLTIFPSTDKNIGTIPQDWTKDINYDEQTKKAIYESISLFQSTNDITELEKNLTKILKKPTKIIKAGQGNFGICYKIAIKDCKDTCLKIYKKINTHDERTYNHGEFIEPQTGMFINSHSNDFVKMLFGRLSTKNNPNGFMVTEYIDENTNPEKTNINDSQKYKIYCKDSWGDQNKINGKIIDFGDIEIRDENNKLISLSFKRLLEKLK